MKERSDAYLDPSFLYSIASMKVPFIPLDLILQSHTQKMNTFQNIKKIYKPTIIDLNNMNCI